MDFMAGIGIIKNDVTRGGGRGQTDPWLMVTRGEGVLAGKWWREGGGEPKIVTRKATREGGGPLGTCKNPVFFIDSVSNRFLQASFCGSSMDTLPDGQQFHFTIQDYESIGYHFCDTLLDFFDPDTTKVTKNTA